MSASDGGPEAAPRARRIGRYEIVEPIASGGMATVHLARMRGPGGFRKLVALKTIHPHLLDQEGFVEMFLDEARLAAAIHHPHVASVLDFGAVDGAYFLAMELLVGETLARLHGLVAGRADLRAAPEYTAYV